MGEAGLTCNQCNPRCAHARSSRTPERAVGCHVECLEFVPRQFRAALFEDTWYRYQPGSAEDDRRARWLRRPWSSILSATSRRLPLELCGHVAQYCLRRFAV